MAYIPGALSRCLEGEPPGESTVFVHRITYRGSGGSRSC
jgi:hypothetical protein